MAILIEIDYSKKLGLPGYSSHQCSVSLRTEVPAIADVPREVDRLYALLQESVDRQIVQSGFVPGETPPAPVESSAPEASGWNCSDKQRQLIGRILDEQGLDVRDIDQLARQRFGAPLVQLNKLQASGLIDELLGKANGRTRRGSRPEPNRRAA